MSEEREPDWHRENLGVLRTQIAALQSTLAEREARIAVLSEAATKLIEGARNIAVQHGAYPEGPLWKVQDADLKALIAVLSTLPAQASALLDVVRAAEEAMEPDKLVTQGLFALAPLRTALKRYRDGQ